MAVPEALPECRDASEYRHRDLPRTNRIDKRGVQKSQDSFRRQVAGRRGLQMLLRPYGLVEMFHQPQHLP